MADRDPHYFDAEPAVRSRPRTVELHLPDLTLSLRTDAGVFSADRVDPGTRLLLQEAPTPPEQGHLLDLGCGYGPIAAALASRSPAADVWAVDVNERAVALCAENARANDLRIHTAVVAPDGRPTDPSLVLPTFDLIWSNPPIRVGKPALHRLLTTWLGRLGPEGRAVLVVQRHLGADSLARWLTEQGWSTTRLVSRTGYRLLSVARQGAVR